MVKPASQEEFKKSMDEKTAELEKGESLPTITVSVQAATDQKISGKTDNIVPNKYSRYSMGEELSLMDIQISEGRVINKAVKIDSISRNQVFDGVAVEIFRCELKQRNS